jgi:hypothetical protein
VNRIELPVIVTRITIGGSWLIVDADGVTICNTGGSEFLAREIARLLNLHDEFVAALGPFAACNPTMFSKVIPDESSWLWKPSNTNQELPGISVAHIKAAKKLLEKAKP